MDKDIFICAICNEETHKDDLMIVANKELCLKCAAEYYD